MIICDNNVTLCHAVNIEDHNGKSPFFGVIISVGVHVMDSTFSVRNI